MAAEPFSLETLFGELQRRGIAVGLAERARVRSVFAKMGRAQELLGSAAQRAALQSILIKRRDQRLDFDAAYWNWLRAVDARIRDERSESAPSKRTEDLESANREIEFRNLRDIQDAADPEGQAQRERFRRRSLLAFGILGILLVSFLSRFVFDPAGSREANFEPTPIGEVKSASTSGVGNGDSPTPKVILEQRHEPLDRISVPTIELTEEAEALPGSPTRTEAIILAFAALFVGLLSVAVFLVLAQRLDLRPRLDMSVVRRARVGALRARGAEEELLEPRLAKEMVFGVERFLDDSYSERIDLVRTVRATAKEGGVPILVREQPSFERSVWLWKDESVRDVALPRWIEEIGRRLERAAIEVRRGFYHDVPFEVEFEDDHSTIRPESEEARRRSTVVLAFTDGRGLLRELESRWSGVDVERLLAGFRSWDRFAFVVVGEGGEQLREVLEDHELAVLHPEQIPEFLLGIETSTTDRPVGVVAESRRRLNDAWHAALALGAPNVDYETALAIRPVVAKHRKAEDFDTLGFEFDGRGFHVDEGQLSSASLWLCAADWHRSEDRSDGRFEVRADSVLGRATRFWRERTALEHARRVAGLDVNDRDKAIGLELKDALFRLWVEPEEATRILERIANEGLGDAVRHELRSRVPFDCDRDRVPKSQLPIWMPWKLDDLSATTRTTLARLGLGEGILERIIPPVGLPQRFALVAAALVGAIALGRLGLGSERELPMTPMVSMSGTRTDVAIEIQSAGERESHLIASTRGRWSRTTMKNDTVVGGVIRDESIPNPEMIETPDGPVEIWRAGRVALPSRPTDTKWPKCSAAWIVVEGDRPRDAARAYAQDMLDQGTFDFVVLAPDLAADGVRGCTLPRKGLQMIVIAAAPIRLGDAESIRRSFEVDRAAFVRFNGFANLAVTNESPLGIGEVWREEVEIHEDSRDGSSVVLARGGKPILEFMVVPSGTFRLGSPKDEKGRFPDEGPVENVRVESFAISRTEITRRAWRDVMGQPPKDADWSKDGEQDAELPANYVSWFDALEFCNALSRREGRQACYTLTKEGDAYTDVKWNREANGYRLPIEAEWEYAARAGTTTPYPWPVDEKSDGDAELSEHAWWYRNSDRTAKPVGTKPENGFRLHDMIGNVWEWCWDEGVFDDKASGLRDPPAAAGRDGNISSSGRVVRGGSFLFGDPRGLRSACRAGSPPGARYSNQGFRCVAAPLRQHALDK